MNSGDVKSIEVLNAEVRDVSGDDDSGSDACRQCDDVMIPGMSVDELGVGRRVIHER